MWRNFGKLVCMLTTQPLRTTPLQHPLLHEKRVEMQVLRLDDLLGEVSGNKFFKLKYNLQEAIAQGHAQVLTFGGAYSNHIYATASAAKELGLASIGILRGEQIDPENPSLQHAQARGMRLHGISREAYRDKTSPAFIASLEKQFGRFYLIPEGGTNTLAIQGTAEILTKSHADYTHICTPVGTGGTFAGLASALQPTQLLLGFSALKGEGMHEELAQLLHSQHISPKGTYRLLTQYHHGGYAKWSSELIDFIHWFWEEFGIPLDPIYTGKMAYGCWDLLKNDQLPPGTRLLMVHTGGLQGNKGFTQRTGIVLPRPSA
jgi:1-aminocyclopropane-1-carboxylate deaminase/D-cysteine desulfhydrase-like pyridoxal-dependent ACC family enzyme